MTFSTKISMAVSAAFLASVLIMAYVGYRSTTRILEDEIRVHLEEHSYNAMDKLDRMLRERYADMVILTTDSVISSRGSAPEQITDRLKKYRDNYGIYSSLSFFDMKRRRIADTSGKDVGKEHPPTEYWQEITAGRDIVMKITESRTTGQVIIHFVAVVKDMRGTPFGVVAARMPVEIIYELVESSLRPPHDMKNTRMELLNGEGLILYSSYNRQGILKKTSGDWVFLKEMIAAGKKSGSVRHAYEGEDEISAFAKEEGYGNFSGNGWVLVICTPAAEAFAPAYTQGKMFAGLYSVFIGVVIAATFLVSKSAVAPLKRLTRAARDIGKGNLDMRVAVKSADEIGQLSEAFNTMAADLSEREIFICGILDSFQDGISILDKDLQVVRTNRTMELWFSDRLPLSGRKCYEAYHGLAGPCEDCPSLRTLRSGRPDSRIFPVMENENVKTWLEHHTFPIFEPGTGSVTGIIEHMRDITERIRADKTLRESEEKLRILADTAQDAIVMADNLGNISFWNKAAEKIFGYGSGEAMGRELHVLIAPKAYHEAYEKGFARFRETGEGAAVGRTLELDALRRSGEEFPIELSLSAMLINNKWHAAGVIRDITERKKTEEIIQLHRRVTERLNDALVELAKEEKIYGGGLETAFSAITEASARAMDIRRVSIWFYAEGNTGIKCMDVYDMNSGRHSSGAILEARVYPGYFRAMQEGNLIAADDAVNDTRTTEFAEAYLKPLGIASMLDVPIRVSGKVIGVVCHEHVGVPRSWTAEEQSFATAIAGFTAVAIEIAERKKVEETLIVSEGKIKKMKEDVELRLHEAERINRVMVGRELKMEEMRREMIRLRARIGEPERKE